jgi:hypothetical protein
MPVVAAVVPGVVIVGVGMLVAAMAVDVVLVVLSRGTLQSPSFIVVWFSFFFCYYHIDTQAHPSAVVYLVSACRALLKTIVHWQRKPRREMSFLNKRTRSSSVAEVLAAFC